MTIQSEPLVSIVTPVYNEELYLHECIESVLSQTYRNWEYIICDNCSTDRSREIARDYARKDSRIRFYENQQFMRVHANHNAALRKMSEGSKYCKLVFGDDWLFPDCVERMVTLAEAHPSVGIVGAYGIEGRQVAWAGLPYPSTVVSGREICRRLFLDGLYVFGTGTSSLYRADLVRERDPFLNENNFHADMEVCIALLRNCDYGFVHQVLSFSRLKERSLMTMARTMNLEVGSALHDLVTYGRYFLTESELDRCIHRRLDEYYSFLGGSVLRRRPRTFWDHHRRALSEAGFDLSRGRLAKAAVAKLLSAALSPRETLHKLIAPGVNEESVFLREVAVENDGGTTDSSGSEGIIVGTPTGVIRKQRVS